MGKIIPKESKLRFKNIIAIGLLALAVYGCSVDVSDTQIIDIELYAENDKNVKLAEDLMYYDPRYLAFKIPAFDESTSQGIRLGYFIRSSDGKPSYRVTYSLKTPSVAANITELKKGFETFIPELASFHASKEPIFVELEPEGMRWSKSLFTESALTLLSESSTLLKEAISPDQFSKINKKLLNEYGNPQEMSFVRAQYYEAFGEMPESVSLFYLAKFSDQKALMVRISMHHQGNKWLVIGFNLEPVKA